MAQQIFTDARGRADTDHQHARRHRIECARVAHLPQSQGAAHALHYVVRGDAVGLIDDEEAGGHVCLNAANTRLVAVANGPSMVAPAANGCPPPPSAVAAAETLKPGLARRLIST